MRKTFWPLSNIIALAVGGLVGVGATLLIAPRSGRAVRARLRSKGILLKDRMGEEAILARSKVKDELNVLTLETRRQASRLGNRLQEALENQRDRIKGTVSSIPLPLHSNGR